MKPTRSISVLIADDSKSFVNRVQNMLTDVDEICGVRAAYNFKDACDLLSTDPDIILLDINLAGDNGLDLLRHIRQSGRPGYVIMITNFTGEAYRRHCINLGADYFLDKTNEFDRLPGMIRELALKRRSDRILN